MLSRSQNMRLSLMMLVIVAGVNGSSTSNRIEVISESSSSGLLKRSRSLSHISKVTNIDFNNQANAPVPLSASASSSESSLVSWGKDGYHVTDPHDVSGINFTFTAGSEGAQQFNNGKAGTIDLNALRGREHVPYADLYAQKESRFWRYFSYIFVPSIACIVGGVFLNQEKKAQLATMLFGSCSFVAGYHRFMTMFLQVSDEEISKEFPDEFRLANYAQQTKFLENYSKLTLPVIAPDDVANIDAMNKNHSVLEAAVSFMRNDNGQRNTSLRNDHIRRNIGQRKGDEGLGLLAGGAASILVGYLASKVDIIKK